VLKKNREVKSELFIQVAVPSPLRRTFDYRPPDNCDRQLLLPGVRVQVPFGNRKMIGLITACSDSSDFPPEKIKKAIKVIDTKPLLDNHLLALYQWAADYYQFPLGQALQTSLPGQLRKGKPAIEPQTRYWRLTTEGQSTDLDKLQKAPRQQQIVSLLGENEKLTATGISTALGIAVASALKSLQQKGFIEEVSVGPRLLIPDSDNLYGQNQPLHLNKEQQDAYSAIIEGIASFNTTLLEGVTGSGKTEIYLQLITDVLKAGKQVLVLVPEISLTPQTIRRFENRFNREIVAFHSGLSDNQRLTAWLRAKDGSADIIIGTRSAVFTPMRQPGLIIVDEEHDSSYKQQDGFRYSGRDLAIYRGRQMNIPVVLGTATPSLESLNNALSGRYHYLQLTHRAGEAIQPEFRLLDLKGEVLTDGFSDALIAKIHSHLEDKNQVLIFLNRRGFAPILLCRQCGWIATCPRCDSSYTLHRHPPKMICHHCEGQKPVARKCPECQSIELETMGLGTEKTEHTLESLFPDLPVYRIDRDSTRNRHSLHAIIEKIDGGDPCLLVGTQMLSKGHHFPNVTLVAVLDADGGLFSGDFRGQEHMGQLMTQVAGRAGRGTAPGEVVIQTYNSSHPTMQALVGEGYVPFAMKLLEERRLGNLPPFTYMALIRAEAANRMLPEKFLEAIGNEIQPKKGLLLIGPIPSPMEKKGGLFRFQVIIESARRSELQRLLIALMPFIENHPDSRKVRWSVDVDPVDFT
jgi:primosomal protein N' (replication factor Y) (superfamily II helicase)